MSDQKSSSGDVRAIAILSLVIAIGTTLFLESKELRFAKSRSLSSTRSYAYPVNFDGTVAAIEPTFMEAVDCGFPIPTSDANETEPSDNACVRFFPERFFQTLATPFQRQYMYSKQVKTEHPVVHMTLQNTSLPSDNTLAQQYPTSLTYFHIRKCGGTTMFRSVSSKSIQIPYRVNKYNKMMIDKMGIVQDIYDNQQTSSGQQDKAVVFSFVRDPVVRFLSSVGQMLHMGKVKLFPHCRDQRPMLEEISLKESNSTIAKSQTLVHCMLKSMKSSPTAASSELAPWYDFIDQHMLPQAFELRARSLEKDISIHLMGMEQIAPTLKALVGADRQNRHARSSRVADYTQGYFLETSILTTEMIRDICHIYAVDVLLLKRTGVASTLCDASASLSLTD